MIPVPKTVSPEAQAAQARVVSDADVPQTLQQRRDGTDKWQNGAGEVSKELYPAEVHEATIAGVPVRLVTPLVIAADKRDRVLINLHGGGFNSDSGSLTETVPIANLTGVKVVAVLYRLAPEHPFPAALDDSIAVYKELLKTYKASHIGIYGTSAGAILTAEVTVKLKQLGLPLPGVTGIFSGTGDLSQPGDSNAMYALNGLRAFECAKAGDKRYVVYRDDGPEGPDPIATLRGLAWTAADAVCHERPRPAAERDDDSAARLSAGRCGYAAGGV